MIRVEVPGKLMICGEYAVIEGAPAILAPSHHRAIVTIDLAEECHTVISSLFPNRIEHFRLTPEGTRFTPEPEDQAQVALLRCVLDSMLMHRQIKADMPLCEICIDSAQFVEPSSGDKLGAGSSAAVCVALVRALLEWNCRAVNDPLVFNLAAKAHSLFQNGRGSNADIATCTYGQLLCYQSSKSSLLNWPQGLLIASIWTGASASTTHMLQRLNLWQASNSDDYAQHMTAMKAIAVEVANLFFGAKSNADAIVTQVREYTSLLESMAAAADLSVFSDTHRRLADRAVAQRLVYKPSGAGGGDYGLVLTTNADDLERFVQQLDPDEARHFSVLGPAEPAARPVPVRHDSTMESSTPIS